jgi:crossover junction endodeoxyribonuclease RusA
MAGGHAIMAESSKKVLPWREAVKAAAPSQPRLDGPLAVHMVFTLRRPASARKSDLSPCRTPDLSKLARATEDAITDAGLWGDDARVSQYVRLAKVWSGYDRDALNTPGVLVAAVEMQGDRWGLELYQLVCDLRPHQEQVS